MHPHRTTSRKTSMDVFKEDIHEEEKSEDSLSRGGKDHENQNIPHNQTPIFNTGSMSLLHKN